MDRYYIIFSTIVCTVFVKLIEIEVVFDHKFGFDKHYIYGLYFQLFLFKSNQQQNKFC